MFFRFKGEDSHIKTDVVYCVHVSTVSVNGAVNIMIAGMFSRRYESFEEMITEWEIV